MPTEKRWVITEEVAVPGDFQAAVGGHPLVAQTLYSRGIQSIEVARAFLDPAFYMPTSADELPDIQTAYELLIDALNSHKRILVWGDFDVDGQTATTTLVEGLRELGGEVSYHIPVRAIESHGITHSVLTGFLNQGFDLLLTCDTGISEHENIQMLRDAGVAVIVTDHHTLGETLPPANAVINPQRLQPDHPLRSLPGVGVAYKLIEGLFAALNQTFDSGRFVELTALGIVADVAELKGDTRYLLQTGLANLRQSKRVGLTVLYKNANLNPLHLNEGHIGFQIAPRLNAVGRLGDANSMVEFLTTQDAGRARVQAAQIEAMNAKRQFDSRQVEKAAEAQISASPEDRHAPAIVLHHPNWPGGVVGIVAGHLVERYQKPALLLTGNDPIHGSARSIGGVNITQAIASQAEWLTGYGGHPMAAGLSLPKEHLGKFKRGFLSAVEAQAKDLVIVPELRINRIITLDEISLELIEQIARLAPFGPSNPPLHFLIQNLDLVSVTEVGQTGEHRQVIVSDADENQQRFIWWNGGDEPLPEAQFDLVCTLSISDYKGSAQISAQWTDFRLSEIGRQQVAKRHIQIIDHRESLLPMQLLPSVISQFPGAAVWGESDLPKSIPALKRYELKRVSTLIIWTSPPSQSVLCEALRTTQPDTVVVFGQKPIFDTYQGLMNRVAGLAKFAVAYKKGQTTLNQLAAACAANNETIRVSLKLWEALGNLSVEFDEETVMISLKKSQPNPSDIEIFEPILAQLFEESQSFRWFFANGALNSFLRIDPHAAER